MRRHDAQWVSLVIGMLAMGAGVTVGDYWDDFSDGWYDHWTDPNHPNYGYPNNLVEIDPCNPDWWVYDDLPGINHYWLIGSDSVIDKGLLLSVNHQTLFPGLDVGFIAATVDDYGRDANTSLTWFDDSTDHYILAYVYYADYYDPNDHNGYNDPNYDPNDDDPNDDKGNVVLLMHADDASWHTLGFEWMFHNLTDTGWPWYYQHMGYMNLFSVAFDNYQSHGSAVWNFRRTWMDPEGIRVDPNTGGADPYSPFRDPNDTTILQPEEGGYNRNPIYDDPSWYGQSHDEWDRTGLWMLCQFETNYDGDPNVLGKPNGKWFKGAVWRGGKYDWNGTWTREGELSSGWASGGQPTDWYWGQGMMGLGTWTDLGYLGGNPAAAVFDNVEVRTGKFSAQSWLLSVLFYHGENGTATFDPDTLADPNQDPNDPNAPRKYTDGTEVTLTAIPNTGKIFLKWKVMDGEGGALYEDTNQVMYLTMDQDYQVEAQFKCGSSVPPFVGMTLLALAAGALLRRWI